MQIQAFLIDSTEYGGNARQLLASVTQLRAMDYKVAVGVLGKKTPWSKLLSDTGAMVTHFESKGLWDIRALFRLREWIKNLSADSIHVITLKAMDALGISSPSYISRTFLSGLPQGGVRVNPWRQKVFARVKKIFCPTIAFQNKLIKLGMHPSKAVHLPPGISLLTANSTSKPFPHTPYLLDCGPFNNDFNHRDALWCMDILHYVKPEVKLCLSGNGAQLSSLRSFRSALLTKDKIHFTGATEYQETLLKNAFIVLITNINSGGYYSALESMLSGKPLVASSTPGMEELVVDKSTGVLFTPGEPAELAKKIRLLIDEPARAEELATKGRESAESRFSAKHHVAKMLQYQDD